jgi:hypothetical protein
VVALLSGCNSQLCSSVRHHHPKSSHIQIYLYSMQESKGSSNPDPAKRYPNPTFGLALWGPLIPASDCRACLYTLASIQGLSGLIIWWYPRKYRRPTLHTSIGSLWRARFARFGGILLGGYLVLQSSLELIRLQLPNDPWAEDAIKARRDAERRGEKVSYWFGPRGYKPVEFSEWKKRVDSRLAKGQAMEEKVQAAKHIYEDLRKNNRAISSRILEDLRRNKQFEVSDKALERTQERFEGLSEEEVNEIKEAYNNWDENDPWDNLHEETELTVRFVPHARGIKKKEESAKDEEHEGNDDVLAEFVVPAFTNPHVINDNSSLEVK